MDISAQSALFILCCSGQKNAYFSIITQKDSLVQDLNAGRLNNYSWRYLLFIFASAELKKRNDGRQISCHGSLIVENYSSCNSSLAKSFTAAPEGSEQFVPMQTALPRLLTLSQ